MGSGGHHARAKRSVACAVITASDTRTPENDTSGQAIKTLLESAGHAVVAYDVLPDEPARIGARVGEHLRDAAVEAVLVNGGTGVAPRDTTYEAIDALLEKRLDGFGELFRMLSFEEIGAAAMLSRAVAGIAAATVVFSMPGSTKAVELAMRRLVLPELGHLVALVRG
jgi:molybdenum cofactor biosynthesis protein B